MRASRAQLGALEGFELSFTPFNKIQKAKVLAGMVLAPIMAELARQRQEGNPEFEVILG